MVSHFGIVKQDFNNSNDIVLSCSFKEEKPEEIFEFIKKKLCVEQDEKYETQQFANSNSKQKNNSKINDQFLNSKKLGDDQIIDQEVQNEDILESEIKYSNSDKQTVNKGSSFFFETQKEQKKQLNEKSEVSDNINPIKNLETSDEARFHEEIQSRPLQKYKSSMKVLDFQKQAENQLYSIRASNQLRIQFDESKNQFNQIEYKNYSKFLSHGITPQVENQQHFKIFQGNINIIDKGELIQWNVQLFSYHERNDLRIIPKIAFKNGSHETGYDSFVQKPLNQEMKREISKMKTMQMSNYQRYFSGWVESTKKQDQDIINDIGLNLLENNRYCECNWDGDSLIRLYHSEQVFQEAQDLTFTHPNYKINTQLIFIIALPIDYYSKFVNISES